MCMEDPGDEGLKDRLSSRGEDALGDFAQALLDNPWFKQVLEVALEARERASQAGASAMRNLNVPAAADVDRLGRRLRAVSERLEAVEDKLDELGRELAELRRGQQAEPAPGTTDPNPPGRL
jgi:hypothetical protein